MCKCIHQKIQNNVCTKCNPCIKLLCYWIIWMWYGLDESDTLRAITSNILYRTCGKAILHLVGGVIAWVVILLQSFREAGDDRGWWWCIVTVTDFFVAKMTLLVMSKTSIVVCVDDEKHVCHLPSLHTRRCFIANVHAITYFSNNESRDQCEDWSDEIPSFCVAKRMKLAIPAYHCSPVSFLSFFHFDPWITIKIILTL